MHPIKGVKLDKHTVEAIDLRYLPRFVVSAQQGDSIRISVVYQTKQMSLSLVFCRQARSSDHDAHLAFRTRRSVSVSSEKWPLSTKSPCNTTPSQSVLRCLTFLETQGKAQMTNGP